MKLLLELILILLIYLEQLDKTNAEELEQQLLLTPLIEEGEFAKAKRLSQVTDLPVEDNKNFNDIISYSGYLTVNKKYNSNLFFWFFPALNKNPKAPTLLWLQGEPGTSSLLGALKENGPIKIGDNFTVIRASITWAHEFNMLYIDQPVGVGFSFTNNIKGYAPNVEDVSRDLYEGLIQFFTLFYEYRQNHFYITGESNAGKYISTLGYKIHMEGANCNIAFKGIAIGNGAIDPITETDYADYMFHAGLIDDNQRNYMNGLFDNVRKLIKEENYNQAYYMFDYFFKVTYQKMTGLENIYNFRLDKLPKDIYDYGTFALNSRRQFHVGNQTFNDVGQSTFDEVSHANNQLLVDRMSSGKNKLITLMSDSRYKTLLYYGQFDIIDNFSLAKNFLWKLEWAYSQEYHQAKQIIWHFGDRVAGYARHINQLTLVLVRDAGHFVPIDKPEEAYDMIKRFVNDIPFN